MKDISKLKQEEEKLAKRLIITRNKIADMARTDEKSKFRIYGAAMLRGEKDGSLHSKTVGAILDLHVTNPKDRKLVGLSAPITDNNSNITNSEESI
jgi:hypothetical protein